MSKISVVADSPPFGSLGYDNVKYTGGPSDFILKSALPAAPRLSHLARLAFPGTWQGNPDRPGSGRGAEGSLEERRADVDPDPLERISGPSLAGK